jgi:hypothetical protein
MTQENENTQESESQKPFVPFLSDQDKLKTLNKALNGTIDEKLRKILEQEIEKINNSKSK